MKNVSLKKNKQLKNVSKKKIENIICKTSEKAYHTFEDKVEELFKKNNIDIISSSYNLEKQIVKDLKTAVNPSGIQPNDDFFSYVNDRWISDFDLQENQKYIVQIDDFRLKQDKVYRELIKIIEDYISDPATKNSKKTECIKKAYTSFKTYNTNAQTKEFAKIVLMFIDELSKDKENVWELLGTFNRNELTSWGCPFVWSINPDEKNPKIYKCYLEPPQLTLIDINLYFEDDESTDTKEDILYKKQYIRRYFKYLNNLFEIAFGKNHEFNVKDIYDTECEILNAMACNLINIADDDKYNLITNAEALKNFGFNWSKFCKHLGFKKIPDSFITSNVNYFLCGTKLLLEKWDTPKWRTFWIYLYIRQQCRWNKEGYDNYYEFNGNFVNGQTGNVDEYIRPIFSMGFLFNTFLSNQYILHYNNPQAINYVTIMVEDLKSVFIRIIKRNKWLQPKTKVKALEKLKKLKLIVGSPKILREDPLLNYVDDDPWGNLMKMSKWRHDKAIELVDKHIIDIPVIDWSKTPPKFIGTQSYVVNATYTPTQNEIYIPLGYVQKPFVDLDERGMEYNLARIGFTIAHEMSHALDDFGSKYDANGVLNDWWTKEDKLAFKKIQDDIIKQYEYVAMQDGHKFDAVPSIGEDLADISGLAICQEYLRDFQLKNEDILPIQALSFEAFFIYFAIQTRQKISKKAILAQLKTNPHPLDKYRCNVPLSRTKVFRAIYNVKKGDKMWWHSTNSVWD